MKKILLVLVAFGLILGIASCENKLEYELKVSGDVIVLDSAAVIHINKVFTDLSVVQINKDIEIIQDDQFATDFYNYEKALQAAEAGGGARISNAVITLPQVDIDKLLGKGISSKVLSYYIYVQGYFIEPNTGLKLNVDRTFELNWKGDAPVKPAP